MCSIMQYNLAPSYDMSSDEVLTFFWGGGANCGGLVSELKVLDLNKYTFETQPMLNERAMLYLLKPAVY